MLSRGALILALVLVMATGAVGAAEKVGLGPYEVQFDLNTTENYTIKLNEPQMGEEREIEPDRNNSVNLYSFLLALEDGAGATVSVMEWLRFTDATFMESIALQRLMYECYGYANLSGYYLDIDGHQGYLMIAEGDPSLRWGERNFAAWYWLDKIDISLGVVSYGRTRVGITGNISSELTERLLETIRVMRA